jgi:predicted Rossmann-fold nucleotide-binding protein
MMCRHLAIISGGQTGVDRGALDAALEVGAQCGGWCPPGWMAEDGAIPSRYPLTVLAGAGYPERTRRNVEDSDGTLIVHFGALSAGTLLTLQICAELEKPVRVIDGNHVSAIDAAAQARHFIDAYDIHRLNVAGPRASQCATASDYARAVIRLLLLDVLHETPGAYVSRS